MTKFTAALLPLALLAAAGCVATDPSMKKLQTLSGTYADGPEGYAYGKAFGKRTFTFKNGAWTLDFTLALDPGFTAQVFTFRTLGSYEVVGPSAKVPGAYDAVFKENQKFLTLKTTDAALANGFGFGACALTPNVEKDVSVEGCLGWKPVSVCSEDHDLLALTSDGSVRFGVRPADNDMCTPEKRPTELTPAVKLQP